MYGDLDRIRQDLPHFGPNRPHSAESAQASQGQHRPKSAEIATSLASIGHTLGRRRPKSLRNSPPSEQGPKGGLCRPQGGGGGGHEGRRREEREAKGGRVAASRRGSDNELKRLRLTICCARKPPVRASSRAPSRTRPEFGRTLSNHGQHRPPNLAPDLVHFGASLGDIGPNWWKSAESGRDLPTLLELGSDLVEFGQIGPSSATTCTISTRSGSKLTHSGPNRAEAGRRQYKSTTFGRNRAT